MHFTQSWRVTLIPFDGFQRETLLEHNGCDYKVVRHVSSNAHACELVPIPSWGLNSFFRHIIYIRNEEYDKVWHIKPYGGERKHIFLYDILNIF